VPTTGAHFLYSLLAGFDAPSTGACSFGASPFDRIASPTQKTSRAHRALASNAVFLPVSARPGRGQFGHKFAKFIFQFKSNTYRLFPRPWFAAADRAATFESGKTLCQAAAPRGSFLFLGPAAGQQRKEPFPMATQKQIDANRRNAELSTGPQTPEGKQVASLNALQSGIYAESTVIPGEDPTELLALVAEYYEG
jgi:hypothetical protein